MNESFDLITIGDSTIDTFIRIHDAEVECDINHEECKICLSYGSKIPVDAIAHGVAGNAANVAVGGARLGLSTAIYTNLGDDEHGKTIKTALAKEKVAGDYIKVNSGKESNLSVVLTFQGERTIFVYHQKWFYQLPKLAPCKWVYFTSLAETFVDTNIVDEVCYYIETSEAKLVFGPGTHQIKADIKRYPKLLEKCEVLIVNKEEAGLIVGNEEANPQAHDIERELLSKLLLLGPKIVVMTDGAQGSYGSDGQNYFKCGIFPVQLVEKTGAGDGFSSAVVAAFIAGKPLDEALVWGTINASHVISSIGPQKGLMTKDELEGHRKTVPELVASKF